MSLSVSRGHEGGVERERESDVGKENEMQQNKVQNRGKQKKGE